MHQLQMIFQEECVRLIRDLNRFDVLRCDKSTAGAGLQVKNIRQKIFTTLHEYTSELKERKSS